VKKAREKKVDEEKKTPLAEEINGNQNRGKLIVDATCAPADISYPTDIKKFIAKNNGCLRIITNK